MRLAANVASAVPQRFVSPGQRTLCAQAFGAQIAVALRKASAEHDAHLLDEQRVERMLLLDMSGQRACEMTENRVLLSNRASESADTRPARFVAEAGKNACDNSTRTKSKLPYRSA